MRNWPGQFFDRMKNHRPLASPYWHRLRGEHRHKTGIPKEGVFAKTRTRVGMSHDHGPLESNHTPIAQRVPYNCSLWIKWPTRNRLLSSVVRWRWWMSCNVFHEVCTRPSTKRWPIRRANNLPTLHSPRAVGATQRTREEVD